MRNALTHFLLAPLVILALTPPWSFAIFGDYNRPAWLWCVLFSGFLAIIFAAYTKANVWVKALVVYSFFLSFVSKAPYISFTMYFSVIICAWYYLTLTEIVDRTPFYKAIQGIFLLIVALIVTQLFGLDTLLNFNMPLPCVLGTIGNPMTLGTFVVAMSPFLIKESWLNLVLLMLVAIVTGSAGTMLAVAAAVAVYAWRRLPWARCFIVMIVATIALFYAFGMRELATFNTFGRGPVWKRTVKLVLKRPVGYGVATYKLLFPLYSKDLSSARATASWTYEHTHGEGLAWRRAHNCWLQILFEVGIPGFLFFTLFAVTILRNVWNDTASLAGAVAIALNMAVHFPTRMLQAVPILIAFAAFSASAKRGDIRWKMLLT